MEFCLEIITPPQTPLPHIFLVSGLFYPFENGDINPSQDDGSSPVIFLENPFVYFGRVYQQTYVRTLSS